MKKYFAGCLSAVMVSLFAPQATAQTSWEAYKDDNARFTVIADGVVRMEWSPSGSFVDAPSFVAADRTPRKAAYTVGNSGKWVVIKTSKMEVRYRRASGQFTPDNLSIASAKGVKPFAWKPGNKQQGNLKGTYRTLDGYNGDTKDNGTPMPLEDGLLATDGWTLIDDSRNFLFDSSDWPWVMPRTEKNGQDWYFMAYGDDYKAALKEFTLFAGKMPLPPRYAFGYWWSRYWSYSDTELRELIDKFHTYAIPLDVLVIDIDWHYVEKGLGGWTGWTWNTRLFPDYARLLSHIRDNGLKVTLNLHPADGVISTEECYPRVARRMGVDPATKKTIPWEGSNKRFMTTMFDEVLHPYERQGVDFWWLDWQQWPYDRKVDSLSNTWWCNYTFFSDMERNRDTRPMLYHRWGGLGNHRYQIGFSGDAYITWKTLAFQPYFTNCASNVLYGYWSHDIGGHQFEGGQHSVRKFDDELYVRWMQYGALSPVLRTHSTKNALLNKEIWNFTGETFEALRGAVLFRYSIVPYIYAMARKGYDDGLSLCRPMYYDYPRAAQSYAYRNQYMFGENIMVAPIAAPMKDGVSTQKVWLPEGSDWYEWHTGALLKGGAETERKFTLTEYPVYVKAGSIIPLYTNATTLSENGMPVTIGVFPGNGGQFDMYEDSGNGKDYAAANAYTRLAYTRNANILKVTIGARRGSYNGMPSERKYSVKVYNSAMPDRVTVDGQSASWRYSGAEMALSVDLPVASCGREREVEVHYASRASETLLDKGVAGHMKRLNRAVTGLKFRDAGIFVSEDLGWAAETGVAVEYFPERFDELVARFSDTWSRLPEVLEQQKLNPETAAWFLNNVGWESEKK